MALQLHAKLGHLQRRILELREVLVQLDLNRIRELLELALKLRLPSSCQLIDMVHQGFSLLEPDSCVALNLRHKVRELLKLRKQLVHLLHFDNQTLHHRPLPLQLQNRVLVKLDTALQGAHPRDQTSDRRRSGNRATSSRQQTQQRHRMPMTWARLQLMTEMQQSPRQLFLSLFRASPLVPQARHRSTHDPLHLHVKHVPGLVHKTASRQRTCRSLDAPSTLGASNNREVCHCI